MNPENLNLLVVNGGSSSIKFAIYEIAERPMRKLSGKIERIGSTDPALTVTGNNSTEKNSSSIQVLNFHDATKFLMHWLEKQPEFHQVICIGHRLVHGMKHTQAAIINESLLNELNSISQYDPDHLPLEVEMIQLLRQQYPQLVQVACFDTAFHTTMPRIAKMLPIPRRFDNAGIQRYGFHGLSYSYLMDELKNKAGQDEASGKIILAHLGNGASLVAVKGGSSIDTSMGFTPAGGTVMGTRCGDLDPGVAAYMLQSESMTPGSFSHLINHESGLLGVSEISADMQELLRQESTDVRAAEAVALFCYHIKKWIGAFAAVLGGLDTLVFSGGIGENAAIIRSRICKDLGYMGIGIDETENTKNAFQISTRHSAVKVRVIPTNEELTIAISTSAVYSQFEKDKQQPSEILNNGNTNQ